MENFYLRFPHVRHNVHNERYYRLNLVEISYSISNFKKKSNLIQVLFILKKKIDKISKSIFQFLKKFSCEENQQVNT